MSVSSLAGPERPFVHRRQPSESLGPLEIAKGEVEVSSVLGEGTFGKVYRGTCRAKRVAVKILHRQELDEDTLDDFRKEVEMLRCVPCYPSSRRWLTPFGRVSARSSILTWFCSWVLVWNLAP